MQPFIQQATEPQNQQLNQWDRNEGSKFSGTFAIQVEMAVHAIKARWHQGTMIKRTAHQYLMPDK